MFRNPAAGVEISRRFALIGDGGQGSPLGGGRAGKAGGDDLTGEPGG
jgi:hypothetical protein